MPSKVKLPSQELITYRSTRLKAKKNFLTFLSVLETMNLLKTLHDNECINIWIQWIYRNFRQMRPVVGMSLWMVVVYGVLVWMLCIVFWDLWYRGRKSPRLFSDVVVTTAGRQRPLVGDISFIKTKLSSR